MWLLTTTHTQYGVDGVFRKQRNWIIRRTTARPSSDSSQRPPRQTDRRIATDGDARGDTISAGKTVPRRRLSMHVMPVEIRRTSARPRGGCSGRYFTIDFTRDAAPCQSEKTAASPSWQPFREDATPWTAATEHTNSRETLDNDDSVARLSVTLVLYAHCARGVINDHRSMVLLCWAYKMAQLCVTSASCVLVISNDNRAHCLLLPSTINVANTFIKHSPLNHCTLGVWDCTRPADCKLWTVYSITCQLNQIKLTKLTKISWFAENILNCFSSEQGFSAKRVEWKCKEWKSIKN